MGRQNASGGFSSEHTRQKEINPFSEQEKHGDGTQGLEPTNADEYQGNPSVQRGDGGVEKESLGERKRA